MCVMSYIGSNIVTQSMVPFCSRRTLSKNREVYMCPQLRGNLSRDVIRSSGVLVIRGYNVCSAANQGKIVYIRNSSKKYLELFC